jgi:DNA-binding response OmpR family regulator
VVLLTAKVLPDDRVRFAQMKIAGVITKPFDPILICDQMAALLNWDAEA